MHTTRQRTKSSFTVEIKRANKRSPDVVTVARAAGGAGDELVERVFGGSLAAPPERGRPAVSGDLHPGLSGRSDPPRGPELDSAQPRQNAPSRRVLPDLLATDVDPVQQRISQQEAERVARRKASAENRGANGAAVRGRRAKREDALVSALAVEPKAEVVAIVAPAATFVPAAERAPKPGAEKRIARPSALKKALKAGQLPPFPAGERWKRRLPKSCW